MAATRLPSGSTENRYAETYDAATPSDAEAMALCEHPDLLIAGVAVGDGIGVRMVDDDPAVTG